MVSRAALLWVCIAGCAPEPALFIVAHRAHGIGSVEENRADNVVPLFEAGFGVEVDIRGDGEEPFALGHFGPNGDTLGDVLDEIEAAWQPQWVDRVLFADIANDRADAVSNGLVNFLVDRLDGSAIAGLQIIVQSSNIQSLARLQGAYVQRGSPHDIRFALTYWISTEHTTPSWIDLVTGNVSAFGELPHPKPVVLFGVETRAAYRRVRELRSDVIGVISDHPRRVAEMCDCL